MYLWPPVWWRDLCGVVNKGVSGVCICSKSKLFWHSGSPTTWILFEEKKGWNWLFLKNQGVKMESWLPACCPSADVVVREQRLTQLGLVMEGEGKKNSRATRQHVLLPVFVSTYYVLPACGWGWGNFKRKESSGPCEKIPSFKRTQTKSEMAKTMVREGKVNS